jgi:hypothetical protein
VLFTEAPTFNSDPEISFWLERGFEDVQPFDLARADADLAGAEALDCLFAFVVSRGARRRNVVVEFPVKEGGGDDCY